MHLDPPAEGDLPRSADDATLTPASEPLVVGLGASAGGIAALQSFFRQMPADSGMAFVVILHLSPEHVSQLAELLQQVTTMPVRQVTEAVPLERDRVYVVPPAQRLTLVNLTLQLSKPSEPRGQGDPIDLLFRSLAESQGPRAAAVVLSGSGADGAAGVNRVKECGGLVLVQDPAEAEFDMMPRHTVDAGLADVVLPVAELPGALVAHWRQARAAAPPAGERDEAPPRDPLLPAAQPAQPPARPLVSERHHRRVAASDHEPPARQLEEEIKRTREQLRAMAVQHDLALEELRASNEELQASNEELRATTEELETSKAELQATNEELQTLNVELKQKIDALSQTTSDLQNLIASTAIGTIFVDRALRIKRYTPSAQAIINLLPSDLNRPLAQLSHRLAYDALSADSAQVLATLVPVEREVESQEGSWYLLRIQPYRTDAGQIDGVVLTFVDITRRRAAEEALRSSEERLRLLIESVEDYAIVAYTPDYRVASWNVGAERILGYQEAEILGQDGAVIFTPEDRAAGVPAREIKKAAATGRAEDERWYVRKDGSRFYASGVMTPMRDIAMRGFVKVLRDLTERKGAEEALRESAVLRQLAAAQEEERLRIARDLHDQLGQQITGLLLGLKRVERAAAGTPIVPILPPLQELADELAREAHQLAVNLRPTALEDVGLAPALERLVAAWGAETAITAAFESIGLGQGRLPRQVEVALFRVAQEALTNVRKHAEASRVGVIIERRGDQVVLVVEDNGRGFDLDGPAPDGEGPQLGLVGMRERVGQLGGTLELESSPGGGTTVLVRVPLRAAGRAGL